LKTWKASQYYILGHRRQQPLHSRGRQSWRSTNSARAASLSAASGTATWAARLPAFAQGPSHPLFIGHRQASIYAKIDQLRRSALRRRNTTSQPQGVERIAAEEAFGSISPRSEISAPLGRHPLPVHGHPESHRRNRRSRG
jgi:hypothetical protein